MQVHQLAGSSFCGNLIFSIFYCLIKQWRKKMQTPAVDFTHVPEE
jgi:hypothetical protein